MIFPVSDEVTFRILFLADTHLGFDFPFQPRVNRVRRGPDFFRNTELALTVAIEQNVDCVVHGGDFFYRSKVPARLVVKSFEPFIELADRGVPIYIVPGNHERSRIPYPLLALHPSIHIFDIPRTYVFEKNGLPLILFGFPYIRDRISITLPDVLKQTAYATYKSAARVLCMHHIVEGAVVGVQNYLFRRGDDIIPGQLLPSTAAVLSGHIHRHQVLTRDLRGRTLPSPVLYPGSIDRTAFDERLEEKGFIILEIKPTEDGIGVLHNWQFFPLPTRAMVVTELRNLPEKPLEVAQYMKELLRSLPPSSIVRLQVPTPENLGPDILKMLTNNFVRSITPKDMIVSVSYPRNWSEKTNNDEM